MLIDWRYDPLPGTASPSRAGTTAIGRMERFQGSARCSTQTATECPSLPHVGTPSEWAPLSGRPMQCRSIPVIEYSPGCGMRRATTARLAALHLQHTCFVTQRRHRVPRPHGRSRESVSAHSAADCAMGRFGRARGSTWARGSTARCMAGACTRTARETGAHCEGVSSREAVGV